MLGESGLVRSAAELGMLTSTLLRLSASALDHHFLDIGNGLSGVQSLRAGPGAVEDGMAPVEPERIFEDIEPFACRLVAAVSQPAPSLEKSCGT
jgi:hypothetical protein